jgi:serine/threonine protein kinase
MTDPVNCPTCGTPMVPAAGGPSCPRCLLAAGLESGAGSEAAQASAAAAAPTPEEMGKHFPSLEILELLGQGGMGIVYKARQRSLDRMVALKVLPPEAALEAGFSDRFSREARTLARLQHPNIVGVHDFGNADGLFYLMMEYVDGANLRQAMQAGKLSPREALAIVPQVCDALQYAHDQGVVHRDIKPENILVDRAGRVRIADFGLAKIVQRTPVDMTITRAGQVMGTLHYMAPEQYRSPDAVDHRADIFSLGVVFYEMLTGELPLGSFPLPSSKAGVDARLDGVVMRALERERDRRWQKVSEVKSHVSEIAVADAAAAAVAAAGAASAAAAPAASPAGPTTAGASAPDATTTPPVPEIPESEKTLSRLAVAGGLGLPAALVASVVVWLLLVPFASGRSTAWAAGLVFCLVALAGWVAAIVGWAHFDRARQRGRGWAVLGTLLPPALFCSGGFLLPLWLVAGSTVDPHASPDSTDPLMPDFPGFSIENSPDRTRVTLPGITVEETPDGTRVKLPGIDVTDPRNPAATAMSKVDCSHSMTPQSKSLLVNEVEELWTETGLVLGSPFESEKVKQLAEDERKRFQEFSLSEKIRRREERLLGVLFIDRDGDLDEEPRDYRLYAVHVDDMGTRFVGRVVRSTGKQTISFPIVTVDGKWRCSIGEVEIEDRAPTPADRDGWLRR